jgi:hypothetical protein
VAIQMALNSLALFGLPAVLALMGSLRLCNAMRARSPRFACNGEVHFSTDHCGQPRCHPVNGGLQRRTRKPYV